MSGYGLDIDDSIGNVEAYRCFAFYVPLFSPLRYCVKAERDFAFCYSETCSLEEGVKLEFLLQCYVITWGVLVHGGVRCKPPERLRASLQAGGILCLVLCLFAYTTSVCSLAHCGNDQRSLMIDGYSSPFRPRVIPELQNSFDHHYDLYIFCTS